MTTHSDCTQQKEVLRAELVAAHGSIVTGSTLVKLLGFPSGEAFRQAKARDRIGIPVFTLPNRRGSFALTSDIADWLCSNLKPAKARAIQIREPNKAEPV